jgi:hypothetical protein
MLGLADARSRLFSRSASRSGRPARRRRRTRIRMPRKSVGAGRHRAVEAAALDGQREGALHLLAGAHAARADDALRRVEGEIGVALVLLRCRYGSRPVAVAHLAQARPRPPCPAIRNRRWPRRSGSRADGRRCRAPSPLAPQLLASRSVWVARPCRSRPAWCRRRACRAAPRSPPGTGGRSRRRSSCRWRRASGPRCRRSMAARMIEVPAGTVTDAVDGQRDLPGSRTLPPACRNRSR